MSHDLKGLTYDSTEIGEGIDYNESFILDADEAKDTINKIKSEIE